MSIFEIMGPIMIGPSSSHTAGAVKIGQIARLAFSADIEKAEVFFHGSFAETYRGHGTDRAIAGGLLGFKSDDERIKDSLELARRAKIDINFKTIVLHNAHPNTVLLNLSNREKTMQIICSSIGGGNINIEEINGYKIDISGSYPAIWVLHRDTPGITGIITSILGGFGLNIAFMKVFRKQRGKTASSIIELDEEVQPAILERLQKVEGIIQTRYLPSL